MRKNTLGRKPVRAYGGKGKTVIYEFDDGTGMVRKSGTISWRSTNPGKIRIGRIAKDNGSIGTIGPYAIFPDFETGRKAVYELFRHDSYQDLTLEEAIIKHVESTDNNDTEIIIQFMVSETGYSRYDLLRDLSILLLVAALMKKVGYWVGEGLVEPVSSLSKAYKWRTQKDNRVRKEHMEREGKVFNWDTPPFDGHPGEPYNCRCWAEMHVLPNAKKAASNHPFRIYITG